MWKLSTAVHHAYSASLCSSYKTVEVDILVVELENLNICIAGIQETKLMV